MAATTYTQEASIILDDVITEKGVTKTQIEVTHNGLSEEQFSLLDLIHPTGEYRVAGSMMYFHVFYSEVEFTYWLQYTGEAI